jgi:hypothetical protein
VLEVKADKLGSYKDALKKLTADIQSKFKDAYLTCK